MRARLLELNKMIKAGSEDDALLKEKNDLARRMASL
jgi:hypothetical protein